MHIVVFACVFALITITLGYRSLRVIGQKCIMTRASRRLESAVLRVRLGPAPSWPNAQQLLRPFQRLL